MGWGAGSKGIQQNVKKAISAAVDAVLNNGGKGGGKGGKGKPEPSGRSWFCPNADCVAHQKKLGKPPVVNFHIVLATSPVIRGRSVGYAGAFAITCLRTLM